MQSSSPQVHRLSEYQIPDFLVTHVDLQIDLTHEPVRVKSRLTIQANPDYKNHPADLVLDGENMKLLSIAIESKAISDTDYILTDKSLTIKNVPLNKVFMLEAQTELGNNTDLFGIYKTDDIYLAKSETEGLRRVLYCKDRPDVLATYTTTIIADEKKYPVLLSNGQLIKSEKMADGIHSATWVDKVPKPSYLFAMVAGDLELSASQYVTKSGRSIPIQFYLKKEAINKCAFAQEVLQKVMAWDEKTYGLECNLSQHMVACVDKYAAGASEPTGLNLFNSEYLYATPGMKTDEGIVYVTDVVSHEYLHYWTGDRVTIRDWHNLSFKEGLATLRSAEFREDLFGRDIVRILDGKNLNEQPSRPSSYTAVRSLYTSAVYEKAADIFQMIKLVLGAGVFHKGVNQFLKKNDGRAVTIEDLLSSLEHSSGVNLSQFLLWFTEKGIPDVDVTDEYDSNSKTYTLRIKQSCPNSDYKPRPIPIVMGLLDKKGNEIANKTLMLDKSEMEFKFTNILDRPVPSLLRSFSAPVNLNYDYSQNVLLLLMQHDTNLYNRHEAAKKLIYTLVDQHCSGKEMDLDAGFLDVYRALLQDKDMNEWLLAEIINIPSEEAILQQVKTSDINKVHEARECLVNAIAKHCVPLLKSRVESILLEPHVKDPQFKSFDMREAGKRKLKNVCFMYLSQIELENTKKVLLQQFKDSLAINMTDTIASLKLLTQMNCEESSLALDMFYQHWQHDANAINYWFRIQSAAHSRKTVENIRKLLDHPAFDISNPTKVYALLNDFLSNPTGFHDSSGSGYQLLTDVILKLDKLNPTVAAEFADEFDSLNSYDLQQQELMREQLVKIYKNAKSNEVKEIAKKKIPTLAKEPASIAGILWKDKAPSIETLMEDKESATLSVVLSPT